MIGMSKITGKALSDDAHLAQSIADILTTPLGSRVMRRDYGSMLPELIDAPFNGATRVKLFGATATALMQWEPRVQLSRLLLRQGAHMGAFDLDLEYRRTDTAKTTEYKRLSVPLNFRQP